MTDGAGLAATHEARGLGVDEVSAARNTECPFEGIREVQDVHVGVAGLTRRTYSK